MLLHALSVVLRVTHQLDGFTAVGIPLGLAEFASKAMEQHAATVETLAELALVVKAQYRLLRTSPRFRMVHRMGTVPRPALASRMHRMHADAVQPPRWPCQVVECTAKIYRPEKGERDDASAV